jgi:hypothetical protein
MGQFSSITSIMDSKFVRKMHAEAHNRENTTLHRVWNMIFSLGRVELLFSFVIGHAGPLSVTTNLSFINIGAISLGIAAAVSCHSPQTTNLNIYTVFPVPYLQNFVANTTLEDISVVNTTLQNISPADGSAIGFPDAYYFGLSGNFIHSLDSFNICFLFCIL